MEHLDVLIVGAGLSGIGAAHHLQTECPWASYAIFEARDAIGGTWDLFRYPGIRSDSDMFTLGYSFRPWTGEKSIADGDSILQYIRDTAAEAGIDRKIRFHHRIVAADWSTDEARWTVTAERTDTGETVELTCGFLFSLHAATTATTTATSPTSPGMDRFAGTIVHPQAWPEDLDYAGKRVVVIGSGATAVTLVPVAGRDGRARHDAAALAHLHRVAAGEEPGCANLLRRVLPERWSGPADPVDAWRSAPRARTSSAGGGPALVKRMLRKGLERAAARRATTSTPTSRRATTRGTSGCASCPTATCSRPSARARRRWSPTASTPSPRRACASSPAPSSRPTSSSPPPGSSCCSSAASSVSVDGETVDLPERLTYKGMMLEGVPNLAMAVGYTNASWTLKCRPHLRATCAACSTTCATPALRQCTPRNHDASVVDRAAAGPVVGLRPAVGRPVPQAGVAIPWQVHQSYLRDWRALKRSDVEDEAARADSPSRCGSEVAGVKHFDGPGRGHHRRRIGHRSGPRHRPGRTWRAPRVSRHRRGRPGRDRGAVRGPRRQGHLARASTWPTGPRSTPGPTRSSPTTAG